MNNINPETDCLIVGAGLAGAIAAHTLTQHGLNCLVLDKGRGYGGRMASRYHDHARWDHGAQFFTVRSPIFQTYVDDWLQHDIVRLWSHGFTPQQDGYPRYRGQPGMTAIAKHLLHNIPTHLNTKVEEITFANGRWHIQTTHNNYHSRTLVITPPAPQALSLFPPNTLPHETTQTLGQIKYAPCFALLLTLNQPSPIPPPGALQLNGEPIHWLADNQQKGISAIPTITIHAGPHFSQTHFDAPHHIITKKLIDAAAQWLNPNHITGQQLHRWRYSHPTQLHPNRYLFTSPQQPVIFAGDAFHEARVEGAALSGRSAALHLYQQCAPF
ncbi:MAG TPA: FAD-dependent oxidoreductase [Anaerolineae bacterium]|nr:FAD-dependent oxidoreductase [Anaerolineae bacterium]